jgi:hypothetical protein
MCCNQDVKLREWDIEPKLREMNMIMESIWNQYGINVESRWNQYGINMESIWNQYGINMESIMPIT